MKKNIALLLGLVLGLGFVSCSSDDDDDESINGEGKYLAEKLITRYDWKDGKRSDEGKLYDRYEYNEKGLLVSRDFPSGYKLTYTHNADGEVIESRLYKNDDLVELFKHEYGNSSLVTYGYNSKNKLVTTVKNEYSQDGKIIKHTEIVDSISKDYGFVSTYSYSGNTETIVFTNLKDGSLNQKHEYEYDSHGNKVKEIYFNYSLQKGYTYENTYEYDAQGRLVSKVCDRDYELVHVNYTYNDDGTIRNEHYINKGEKLFEEYDLEYTYKYKKK